MATNMHLKIASIQGESRKKGHENQIEIQSWSFGMHQEASVNYGAGSGAGRVNVRDLVLTKLIDKSDPALMQYCCNGKHIDEVTLYCEKAGGDSTVEYVKIVMKQVLVTGHNVNGASGGDAVSVDLTLSFAEYVFTYTQQAEDGSAGAETPQGWNVATNQPAA